MIPNTNIVSSFVNKELNNIRFFYHNCSGMRGKIKKLRLDAESSNFDVIIITETWLNDSFINEEILNSNWTIYRRDRNFSATNLTRGGGVLIGVTNKLSTEPVSTQPTDFFEQTFFKIKNGNKNIYIGVVYIPPDSDDSCYSEFIDIYNNILSDLKENDDMFIFGDFNRHNISFIVDELDNHLLPINFNDEIDFELVSSFFSNDMYQINNISNSKERWLDLVFTNAYDKVVVMAADDTEHLFKNTINHNAIIVDFTVTDIKSSKSYDNEIVYDFTNANYSVINNELSQLNWCNILELHDIDLAVSKFYETLLPIIDNHVPKIRKKKNYPNPG